MPERLFLGNGKKKKTQKTGVGGILEGIREETEE